MSLCSHTTCGQIRTRETVHTILDLLDISRHKSEQIDENGRSSADGSAAAGVLRQAQPRERPEHVRRMRLVCDSYQRTQALALLIDSVCSVEIVRKFAGREQELCAKLAKKYGTAPDLGTDAQADTATTSTSVTAGPAKSSSSAAEAQQVGSLVYERGFRPFQIPVSTGGALDFRSPDFDPLQALQKERLPSLTPAYPLDNILKCRHLVRSAYAINLHRYGVIHDRSH